MYRPNNLYQADPSDLQPRHSPLNGPRRSLAWPWAAVLANAAIWAAIALLLVTFGAGPLWR